MKIQFVISLFHGYYKWQLRLILRAIFLYWYQIILNFSAQKKLISLIAESEFRKLLSVQPNFPFKYLKESYLSSGLSRERRAEALICNYHILRSKFDSESLRQILFEELVLLRREILPGEIGSVVLCLSNPCYLEGELSLVFKIGQTEIYVLSFTIVPGGLVQIPDEPVILISRMQGSSPIDDLRRATKALNGVSPVLMLWSVLEGFAKALDINHFAGVPAQYQTSFTADKGANFLRLYDEFYAARGLKRTTEHFFYAPLPLAHKPMDAIRPDARRRARIRRELRQEFADSACRAIAQSLRARANECGIVLPKSQTTKSERRAVA